MISKKKYISSVIYIRLYVLVSLNINWTILLGHHLKFPKKERSLAQKITFQLTFHCLFAHIVPFPMFVSLKKMNSLTIAKQSGNYKKGMEQKLEFFENINDSMIVFKENNQSKDGEGYFHWKSIELYCDHH